MRERVTVRVEHYFRPDPEAVKRAVTALVRLSDQGRAAKVVAAAVSSPQMCRVISD